MKSFKSIFHPLLFYYLFPIIICPEVATPKGTITQEDITHQESIHYESDNHEPPPNDHFHPPVPPPPPPPKIDHGPNEHYGPPPNDQYVPPDQEPPNFHEPDNIIHLGKKELLIPINDPDPSVFNIVIERLNKVPSKSKKPNSLVSLLKCNKRPSYFCCNYRNFNSLQIH